MSLIDNCDFKYFPSIKSNLVIEICISIYRLIKWMVGDDHTHVWVLQLQLIRGGVDAQMQSFSLTTSNCAK